MGEYRGPSGFTSDAVDGGGPATTLPGQFTATLGAPFASPADAVAGGQGPDTWSSTALPSGLSLDPATGAITGTPALLGQWNITLTVIDSTGLSQAEPLTLTVNGAPGTYLPLAPVRICDTRPGNPSRLGGTSAQCNGRTLTAQAPLTIAVGGHFGIPGGATAVVLNVTALGHAAPGYLTVYAGGSPVPTTSNLNLRPSSAAANLVTVGLPPDGTVSFLASATADVAIDLQGYFVGGDSGSLYVPASAPTRICDTRPGNPSDLSGGATQCDGHALAAVDPYVVKVAGVGGVPDSSVRAAVLNVTTVSPVARGYLSVSGGTAPTLAFSNVNFSAGETVAGRVIVPLSTSGDIMIESSVPTDLVIDVAGWFAAAGDVFTPAGSSVRICDTRGADALGPLYISPDQCNLSTTGADTPMEPGQILVVSVASAENVPADAQAVVFNMTAIESNAQTALSVFPGGTVPDTSDLNPAPGMTQANLVVATIGAEGTISIDDSAGTVNLALDVQGWSRDHQLSDSAETDLKSGATKATCGRGSRLSLCANREATLITGASFELRARLRSEEA